MTHIKNQTPAGIAYKIGQLGEPEEKILPTPPSAYEARQYTVDLARPPHPPSPPAMPAAPKKHGILCRVRYGLYFVNIQAAEKAAYRAQMESYHARLPYHHERMRKYDEDMKQYQQQTIEVPALATRPPLTEEEQARETAQHEMQILQAEAVIARKLVVEMQDTCQAKWDTAKALFRTPNKDQEGITYIADFLQARTMLNAQTTRYRYLLNEQQNIVEALGRSVDAASERRRNDALCKIGRKIAQDEESVRESRLEAEAEELAMPDKFFATKRLAHETEIDALVRKMTEEIKQDTLRKLRDGGVELQPSVLTDAFPGETMLPTQDNPADIAVPVAAPRMAIAS